MWCKSKAIILELAQSNKKTKSGSVFFIPQFSQTLQPLVYCCPYYSNTC